MKKLTIALLLATTLNVAVAKPMQSELRIKSIKPVEQTETYGDEVYLMITEFRGNEQSRQYSIPEYPVHWPAGALDRVKDLSVWQGKTNDGEVIELVIEFVEHDAPPFNVDDSIGSVRLRLSNEGNQVKVQWHDPTDVETDSTLTETSSEQDNFKFVGDGGIYQVDFDLSNKPAK